jgi:anti-sigma factor RsiW
MLSLSGHIGSKASALVDGQLSPAEEERAWSHVLACPGCRHLVEHEGWTKRQLGTLSGPPRGMPPERLLGSLYDVDVQAAWADVDVIERSATRRRAAVVVAGGSAVGACALALLAVTGGPTGRSDVPTRPAPADFRGSVPSPTVTTMTPTGETNRVPVWARRSR